MIRKSQSRCLIIAALALLLAACGSPGKPPAGSATSAAACPPCPECPAAAPAAAGKADAKPLQAARWSDLPGWSDDDLAAAWLPFLQSCRGLASRPHWPQWKAVCDEARAMARRQHLPSGVSSSRGCNPGC
jgi:membrane-bound lytic murein transglycosylase A